MKIHIITIHNTYGFFKRNQIFTSSELR